ncbi:hypothetical protein BC628DRAFT_537960 [Trametes gibbosa]|nr:hypothetical protein BC628DRAFT_537960 [Trametes gibbosa]
MFTLPVLLRVFPCSARGINVDAQEIQERLEDACRQGVAKSCESAWQLQDQRPCHWRIQLDVSARRYLVDALSEQMEACDMARGDRVRHCHSPTRESPQGRGLRSSLAEKPVGGVGRD